MEVEGTSGREYSTAIKERKKTGLQTQRLG